MLNHDEARDRIKDVLETQFGCRVHREVLILIPYTSRDLSYLVRYGKLPTRKIPRGRVRVDLLGYKKTNIWQNFAVEVSYTSDLKKDARSLKQVKTSIRIIVTLTGESGKIDDIPLVPYEEFSKWFETKIKGLGWIT